MPIQFDISPVTEAYDAYLPALSQKPKYALWLRPTDGEFQATDLQVLFEAFAPLKGIAWSACSDYKNQSVGSPFAEWQGLVDGVVSESSLRLTIAPSRTVFSGVAWLSTGAYTVLPRFLERRPLYGQGVISFIPPDNLQATKWAKMVQGPGWLWLCQDWVANAPQPALDAGAVTRSYLDMTCEMGGFPGLLWVDNDLNSGLVFFGSASFFATVSARLEGSNNFIRDMEVFRRLFRRGFSFEMCK